VVPYRPRNVRGIIFDSGDTLIYPTNGEWFPAARISEVLRKEWASGLATDQVQSAMREPLAYLDEHHHVVTLAEEHEQWRIFYRMLLERLAPVAGPNTRVREGELIEKLLSLLHDVSQVAVFPEVEEVLQELRDRGLALGVLSDSWPSLRNLLGELGLTGYFDSIVISAELGVTKPDPRTYTTALQEIGLLPQEVLFVDNAPENVKGALRVSMQAVLLDRNREFDDLGWDNVIHSLRELLTSPVGL